MFTYNGFKFSLKNPQQGFTKGQGVDGGLKEIEELKERIQALIRANKRLLEEKEEAVHQLAKMEKQLEELQRKFQQQEQARKEAYERLTTLLDRLERVR